jgi:hypothetical protein
MSESEMPAVWVSRLLALLTAASALAAVLLPRDARA